ncbi:unnamed protein product [Allacma fusca]|uniref:Gustatory receptor n=1 Tax=Allacma fusca TaxID=39272 RepID=A0A8J2P0F8_9HEXA|nr:unnamed protein product [Allacma fusca]
MTIASLLSQYSTEAELVKMSKCTFRVLQLVGYMPNSVTKNHIKPLKRFNFPVIWCLILIIACGIYVSQLLIAFSLHQKWLHLTRKTDVFVYGIMFVTTNGITFYCKIVAIVKHKEFLNFWTKTCKVLDSVGSEANFRIGVSGKYANLFLCLQKLNGSISLILVLLTFLQIVAGLIIFPIFVKEYSIRIALSVIVWSFIGYLHTVFSNCLVFFIRLYTCCFKMVSRELSELNSDYGLHPELIVQKIQTGEFQAGNRILSHCISSFYFIDTLVHEFSKFFSTGLLVEIAFSAVMILVYTFFSVDWILNGYYHLAVAIFPFLLINAFKIYLLGKESSALTSAAKGIVYQLNFICGGKGKRIFDEDLISKGQLLISSVHANPPCIAPGDYFCLDSRLVTSRELLELNFNLGLVPQLKGVSNLKSPPNRNKILSHCVKSYYVLEELISEYHEIFSTVIITEILLSAVILLASVFFSIQWVIVGHFSLVATVLPCSLLNAFKIFLMGKEASGMTSACQSIANQLVFSCGGEGKQYFDSELISKGKLLISTIQTNPVSIDPGNYFRLDGRLVTSILSTLTMYLIIMVQFRQADMQQKQE